MYGDTCRFDVSKNDFEELFDEAVFETVIAFFSFKEEKGSFGGFLKSKLKYYFLEKNRNKKLYSLNKVNEDGFELLDTLESNENIEKDFLKKEEYKNLKKLILKLSPKEKEIIVMYYFQNKRIKQIAKEKQMAKKSISNIKSIALKKLRNEIKNF